MPYARSRYGRRYRRRTYRKRSTYPPVTATGPQALSWAIQNSGKALKIARGLASIVNSEKKFYDLSNTAVAVGSASQVSVHISSVSQGDGMIHRDGQSILCKSILGQLSVTRSASATSSHTRLKYVICRDTRPQIGATPAWSAIYSSSDLQGFLNVSDQPGRFKILKSGTIRMDGDDPFQQRKFYIPCHFHVKWDSSNNCVFNDLWLIMLSDEATNTPSVDYHTRIRFYDN